MLLDATRTALASRFFLAVIISAIAHRCAPLFEVGDLSTEKGDTDLGGLNFRGQSASHLFAGLRFWANYRCCGFLHNFRHAPFQERSLQWDHSRTCVSGWFLTECSERVEICSLRLSRNRTAFSALCRLGQFPACFAIANHKCVVFSDRRPRPARYFAKLDEAPVSHIRSL